MRAFTVLLVVALVGCSEHESPFADAGPRAGDALAEVSTGRTIESACAEQAVVRCRDFEKCASFAEHFQYSSEDDCHAKAKSRCVAEASYPGVARPVAVIDRCTSLLELATCGDDIGRTRCNDATPDVAGTLADGVNCVAHNQCASGLCAGGFVPFTRQCGRCVKWPSVGDPCTDVDVDDTLYCSDDNTWARRAPLGAACTAPASCASGSWCVGGTCVEGVPEGGACGPTVGGCLPGLWCAEGVCSQPDRVKLAALGQPCDGDGTYCRGELRCFGKVCTARESFDSCNRYDFLSCGWTAVCSASETCVPLSTFCAP